MTKRARRRTDADFLGDPIPPEPKSKGGRPVADHRQKLVLAQAQLAEIRAAKLRGDLLPAADVEREWTAALADVRAALLALPARIGSRFNLSREAVAGIDDEIRAALLALAASRGVEGPR